MKKLDNKIFIGKIWVYCHESQYNEAGRTRPTYVMAKHLNQADAETVSSMLFEEEIYSGERSAEKRQ